MVTSKNKVDKDYKIVFLYAIGILFIVAGHSGGGGASLLYEFFKLYSFHLGLFVFCSGYLFKKNSYENVLKFTWKKFKRLIIPMYIWHFIYGIFANILHIKGFTIGGSLTLKNILIMPLITGHQFGYSLSLWFVVPLFILEIVSAIMMKVLKNKEYILFILYFALGCLGIYLANLGYNNGWYLLLTKTLYFFPFFGLGFLYKNKLYKYDKLNNIFYFLISILLQVVMITILKSQLSFNPAWMRSFPKNPIYAYIVGFNAIAFWFRVSKIVEPIVVNSKAINYLASKTYPIMVHNVFGMFLVKTIYALLSKFNLVDHPINWLKYKSDIWYSYLPYGIPQWYFTYFIGALVIPLFIDFMLVEFKKIFEEKRYKKCMII